MVASEEIINIMIVPILKVAGISEFMWEYQPCI